MRATKWIAIGLPLCLLLSGCKLEDFFSDAQALQQKVEAQQEAIAKLQTEISTLTAQLTSQQAAANDRISQVESRVFSLWLEANYDSPSTQLSITDRGYAVVKTNLGNLFFVVQDVSPYANGVKLKLKIGNPNAAVFNGIKMYFSWGKNAKDATHNTKEVDLPNTLYTGSWMFQDIILAPAKVTEMDYLSVSASLNQVALSTPYAPR